MYEEDVQLLCQAEPQQSHPVKRKPDKIVDCDNVAQLSQIITTTKDS